MPGKFDNFMTGVIQGIPVGQNLRGQYETGKVRRAARGSIDTMVQSAIPTNQLAKQEPKGEAQQRFFDTTQERLTELQSIVAPFKRMGDVEGARNAIAGYVAERGEDFVRQGHLAVTAYRNGNVDEAMRRLQMANSNLLDGNGMHIRPTTDDQGNTVLQTMMYDEQTMEPKATMTLNGEYLQTMIDNYSSPTAAAERASAVTNGLLAAAKVDTEYATAEKYRAEAAEARADAQMTQQFSGMKPHQYMAAKDRITGQIKELAVSGVVSDEQADKMFEGNFLNVAIGMFAHQVQDFNLGRVIKDFNGLPTEVSSQARTIDARQQDGVTYYVLVDGQGNDVVDMNGNSVAFTD